MTRVEEGARLLDQNRPAEALALFAASGTVCNDARARFGCAVALQLLGRLDEAEAAYLAVLETEANAEALANLVGLAIEKFDLERVERYSRRLLEIEPDSTIAWQGLLVVAIERRDYEAASSYFARIESRIGAADERAIQYRLNWKMVDRLREGYGAVARAR